MYIYTYTQGYYALSKHTEELVTIVKLFYQGCHPSNGGGGGGGGSGGSGGSSGGGGSGGGGAASTIVEGMRSRLSFATNDNDVLGLIRDSIDNWRTKQYDWFQQRTNNISM